MLNFPVINSPWESDASRQHCQERKAGVARRAPKVVNGEERCLDQKWGDGGHGVVRLG